MFDLPADLPLSSLPLIKAPSTMKTVDQFYTCQMPSQVSGIWQLPCRLRIFQARTNVHTVLVTDMGFEVGWCK